LDGVGAQGHWLLGDPSFDQIDAMIADISEAGSKVHITELDVDPLPREANEASEDRAPPR